MMAPYHQITYRDRLDRARSDIQQFGASEELQWCARQWAVEYGNLGQYLMQGTGWQAWNRDNYLAACEVVGAWG